MLELFFDLHGIHPRKSNCKQALLQGILRCLRISICHKPPDLWRRKNWLLLHDKAPAHHFVFVQEELAKQQVTVLPHPPYPPYLAQCDFSFFPCLKEKLHGCRLQLAEEIVTASREAVQHLPANIFQQCFQQLYHC
jgi:hypothetical protein